VVLVAVVLVGDFESRILGDQNGVDEQRFDQLRRPLRIERVWRSFDGLVSGCCWFSCDVFFGIYENLLVGELV
jgi:hypothetical protein